MLFPHPSGRWPLDQPQLVRSRYAGGQEALTRSQSAANAWMIWLAPFVGASSVRSEEV